MVFFCFIVFIYFIGVILSGVWIGKVFKGVDVRDYGSKNSGVINLYRVLGVKLGVVVLIMDVLKGFIFFYIVSKFNLVYNDLVILGLVVILVYIFFCFIFFKGGKGVVISLGVFLFLIFVIILILLVIFILVVYFIKYVLLVFIIVVFLLLIFIFFIYKDLYLFVLLVIIVVFVIYRYKINILRLFSGIENKFKF